MTELPFDRVHQTLSSFCGAEYGEEEKKENGRTATWPSSATGTIKGTGEYAANKLINTTNNGEDLGAGQQNVESTSVLTRCLSNAAMSQGH